MHDFLKGYVELALPQAGRVQEDTASYLRGKGEDVGFRLGAAYAGYQTLLVLPTGDRLGRPIYPFYLPFFEAMGEMEASLMLAFSGEYKGAIQHLRFVLELALLGLAFSSEPSDEDEVRRWLMGGRTPPMKDILGRLGHLDRFEALNGYLGGEDVMERCYEVYNALSGYVHTRGQGTTGSYLRGSNFPRLNPTALRNWAALLEHVVRAVALATIARFPQALQGFPLFEKFGFVEVPRSGWLEPFEVPAIEGIFEADALPALRAFSDAHHAEVFPVERDKLRKTPDLTLRQLRASAHRWWELMKELDQGHVPGKTWDASFVRPEGSAPQEPRDAQGYVRVVTHARRQLDAADDLMVAHAYTRNLLEAEEAG